MKISICVLFMMVNISLFAQDSLKTVKFPQLIVKNQSIFDILDSVILAEKKCKNYSDSLILFVYSSMGVSGYKEKNDSLNKIVFSTTQDINILLLRYYRILGFLNYKNHRCFYAGDYFCNQLFEKTDSFLTKSFNIEMIKREYMPFDDDTPRIVWHYIYSNNHFYFKKEDSYFNDCGED